MLPKYTATQSYGDSPSDRCIHSKANMILHQLIHVIRQSLCLLIIMDLATCVYASTCQQNRNCGLPSCYCGGREVPGNLKPAEIPQIVAFSFDDAVTEENYKMYQELFLDKRLNPNGCPISMTLFVSHNYTDYRLVRDLFRRGVEVAVHSVTHRTPTTFWKNASVSELHYEIVQQRINLSKMSGIPLRYITGWRSPFLQPTGDRLYDILQDEHFQYDSTLTVSLKTGLSSKLWPQTLDFGWEKTCNVRPCPKNKYQGLWEVPVLMLENPLATTGCQYLDSCRPTDNDEAFRMYWSNFHNHYNGSRAPLMYTMHASWLREKHNFDATNYFLLTLLHYFPDVYIINYQQMISWMQNPTSLKDIKNFSEWKCSKRYLNNQMQLEKRKGPRNIGKTLHNPNWNVVFSAIIIILNMVHVLR